MPVPKVKAENTYYRKIVIIFDVSRAHINLKIVKFCKG